MWLVPGLSWNLPPCFFKLHKAKSSIKRKSDLLSIFYSYSNIQCPCPGTQALQRMRMHRFCFQKNQVYLDFGVFSVPSEATSAPSSPSRKSSALGHPHKHPRPSHSSQPSVTSCSLPQSLGSQETETEAKRGEKSRLTT